MQDCGEEDVFRIELVLQLTAKGERKAH